MTPAAREQAASKWVVRTGGRLPADNQWPEFTAWYAQAANARLFDEMAALWGQLDQVDGPALRANSAQQKTQRRTRRRMASTLAATALALVAAWVAVPSAGNGIGLAQLVDRWRADLYTATAEVRSQTLPDGSTVILDAGSAIALDFSAERRDLRLLYGHARFSVAHDTTRPFAVHAAGTVATALGTVFEVDATRPEQVEVTVLESRVAVECARCGSLAAPASRVLEAHQLASATPNGLAVGTAPVADALDGWMNAQLSFDDVPVAVAAAQLQRWGAPRVLWLGDSGKQHVSAVVDAHDPDAALTLLLQAAGLRSTHLPGMVVVRLATSP